MNRKQVFRGGKWVSRTFGTTAAPRADPAVLRVRGWRGRSTFLLRTSRGGSRGACRGRRPRLGLGVSSPACWRWTVSPLATRALRCWASLGSLLLSEAGFLSVIAGRNSQLAEGSWALSSPVPKRLVITGVQPVLFTAPWVCGCTLQEHKILRGHPRVLPTTDRSTAVFSSSVTFSSAALYLLFISSSVFFFQTLYFSSHLGLFDIFHFFHNGHVFLYLLD